MSIPAARRLGRWLLILIPLALCGHVEATPRRPNVVVLLTDDQRWDALGVVQRALGAGAGFPWFRAATPNIDRLAAEGFRFRNAFVVSSLCSPSRAAFLTGRYNHLNGVVNNHTPFPLRARTYATLLRAAGYRTGYFGKWHMGDQRERPGFDEHASFVDQGVYFDARFLINGAGTRTTGWVDDVSTGYAVGFVRRHAARPFLMVLGFKSPHTTLNGARPLPPPRLSGLFASARLTQPRNATSYPPYDPTRVPAAIPSDWIRGYFSSLVGVDQNVGRVLRALEQAGVADDTVVVFASDNGYLLGEHGIGTPGDPDGNKRAAYEESLRIPLLLRYPRLARRGVVHGAQVLNIDLAPTLLELAGVARPGSMQGRSWVPLLTGRASSVRGRFLYEYFREASYSVPTMVALRRQDYKLVRYPGHPAWQQLFRLTDDPGERRNLVGDPRSRPILRAMNAALDAELAATRYRVPRQGGAG